MLYFLDIFFLIFCSLIILIFGLLYKNIPDIVGLFFITRFLFSMSIFGALIINIDLLLEFYPKGKIVAIAFALFKLDSFALVSKILILCFALCVTLISYNYDVDTKIAKTEFSFLFSLIIIGACLLVSANDFLSLFLSFELQTIPLYAFAAAFKFSKASIEASLKYFLLSVFSSAVMLFGFAILYFESGLTNFIDIKIFVTLAVSNLLYENDFYFTIHYILFFSSVYLIFLGLFFKLAVFPFHFWAPEVFDGMPLSSIIVFSVVPKFSIFVAIIYLAFSVFSAISVNLSWLFATIGLFSIIFGSFGALYQNKISKLIAYSSTSHFGMLTLGLSSPCDESAQVLLLYLFYYMSALLLFCAVWVNSKAGSKYPRFISEFRGLAKLSPVTAFLISVSVFSLMGFPPTLGFFAKLYILATLVIHEQVLLVLLVTISSVIGALFYVWFIKVMYFDDIPDASFLTKFPANHIMFISGVFVVILLILGFFFLG